MRLAPPSPRVVVITAIVTLAMAGLMLLWWHPELTAAQFTPRDAVPAALAVIGLALSRLHEQRKTRLQNAAATAARMELSDAMLRMLTVLDSISDGVFVCNNQGRLTLVNPSGWRLLGIDDNGGLPRTFREVAASVHMRRVDNTPLSPDEDPLALALRDMPIEGMEVAVHHGLYGDDRYLRLSARALRNADGIVVGAVAVAVDVTEVKETQLALSAQARTLRQLNAQLSRLATHDNLTGLLNRRGFEEMFDAALEQAREAGTVIGLLVIDVDHFKQINDTHGHLAGDAVLAAVAERIESSIRSGDISARLGGDEFAVLLNNTDQASATVIARRIHRAILNPITLPSGAEPRVTVSIGVAARPASSIQTLNEFLNGADYAMYTAKHAGRNGVSTQDASPLRMIAS